MTLFDFFVDPFFRAATWGTLFLCMTSSLMGVFLLLDKKTLLVETLSHAAYPGIVLVLALSIFFPFLEPFYSIGAFVFSSCAFLLFRWVARQRYVSHDAALSYVLVLFFGVGIVLASLLQHARPILSQKAQTLLFGQAAWMQDGDALFYGGIFVVLSLFMGLFSRPLQGFLFHREYLHSLGIETKWLERILWGFFLLSMVLGIRCVGVILLLGMILSPAIAARQWTHSWKKMCWIAPLLGGMSGLLGNICSVYFSVGKVGATLPTGPMIVLWGAAFAFLSLFIAPKRGLLFRLLRIGGFRLRSLEENILKAFWKGEEAACLQGISPLWRGIALQRLSWQGWLEKGVLTLEGKERAAGIVRLHRLWEVYLHGHLQIEDPHAAAEEMEHVLTAELEEKLTKLLEDPKFDPHQQPIPPHWKGERR